jgi:hypothetical protein
MVVADFHIVGVLSLPAEADAPLVVDTDRVLSRSVSSKRLQTITGWHSKIVQRARSVQLHELPQGDTLDLGRKSVRTFASPKALRSTARETSDHEVIVSQGDMPSISLRNQPPEPLRSRSRDEGLVVGVGVGVEHSDVAEVVDSQHSGGRVISHGLRAGYVSFLGVRIFQEWRCCAVGKPGSAPSAGSALANRAPTEDPRMGPPFFDRAEGDLDRMAASVGDRSTGNRGVLASPRIPDDLALEIASSDLVDPASTGTSCY